MYGEPRKIREVAERLERRADQLRAEADELHTASETIAWASVAADRMREHARERRDELVRVAREYDEAALSVREHAAEVQRLLDLIGAIERQVRAIVGEAIKDAVGAVVDGIKDALSPGDEQDKRLAATPMPPAGHKDWLEMPDQVPGVRL
jgi:chemotaxis regulatin CheY-phosphate phosphatase CheZ